MRGLLIAVGCVGILGDTIFGWLLSQRVSSGSFGQTADEVARVVVSAAERGDAFLIRLAFIVMLLAGIAWALYENRRDQRRLRGRLGQMSRVMLLVVSYLERLAPSGSELHVDAKKLRLELVNDRDDEDHHHGSP